MGLDPGSRLFAEREGIAIVDVIVVVGLGVVGDGDGDGRARRHSFVSVAPARAAQLPYGTTIDIQLLKLSTPPYRPLAAEVAYVAVAVADNAQAHDNDHVNDQVVRVLSQRPWSPTSGAVY